MCITYSFDSPDDAVSNPTGVHSETWITAHTPTNTDLQMGDQKGCLIQVDTMAPSLLSVQNWKTSFFDTCLDYVEIPRGPSQLWD